MSDNSFTSSLDLTPENIEVEDESTSLNAPKKACRKAFVCREEQDNQSPVKGKPATTESMYADLGIKNLYQYTILTSNPDWLQDLETTVGYFGCE